MNKQMRKRKQPPLPLTKAEAAYLKATEDPNATFEQRNRLYKATLKAAK